MCYACNKNNKDKGLEVKGWLPTSIVYHTTWKTINKIVAKCYELPKFDGCLYSETEPLELYHVNDYSMEGKEGKERIENLFKYHIDRVIEKQGCESYNFGMVLDDLCTKGFINPGKYLVE